MLQTYEMAIFGSVHLVFSLVRTQNSVQRWTKLKTQTEVVSPLEGGSRLIAVMKY